MDIDETRRRMADGRLYDPGCPELLADQARRRDVLDAYNALPFGSSDRALSKSSAPMSASRISLSHAGVCKRIICSMFRKLYGRKYGFL